MPLADGGEGTAAALLAARGGALAAGAGARRLRPADRGRVRESCPAARPRSTWRRRAACGVSPISSRIARRQLVRRRRADPPCRRRRCPEDHRRRRRNRVERRRRGPATGARLGARRVELVAALDVDNPLLGPRSGRGVRAAEGRDHAAAGGAARAAVAALELATAELPGAGAGGGIGGMLMALGATAIPGAGWCWTRSASTAGWRRRPLHHRRGPDRHPDAARQGGGDRGGPAGPQASSASRWGERSTRRRAGLGGLGRPRSRRRSRAGRGGAGGGPPVRAPLVLGQVQPDAIR